MSSADFSAGRFCDAPPVPCPGEPLCRNCRSADPVCLPATDSDALRMAKKPRLLSDGRRFAQMLAFHGHAAAAITHKFHGGQLALAHMGLVYFRSSAERAFLTIAAGVAEVAGIFGHRTAFFAGISHGVSPFRLQNFSMDDCRKRLSTADAFITHNR